MSVNPYKSPKDVGTEKRPGDHSRHRLAELSMVALTTIAIMLSILYLVKMD